MNPLPEISILEAAVHVDVVEQSKKLTSFPEITLGNGFDRPGHADDFQHQKSTAALRNYQLASVHLDTAAMTLIQEEKKIKETNYLVMPKHYAGATVSLDKTIELSSEFEYVMARTFNNNYYHWIVQTIPAVDWSLRNLSAVDIALLSEPLNRWQAETLSLLGYGRVPIVAINRKNHYVIPRLHYSEFQNGTTAFRVSHSARAVHRHLARAAITTSASEADILYVARPDTTNRVAENEPELIKLLEAEGVHVVVPGRLSVAQQINLFNKASAVIGPHGAGLTNVVFCRRGTIFYECIPQHYRNPCFARLAQAANLNYIVDQFDTQIPNDDDVHKRRWYLDADLVLKRVREIKRLVLASRPPRVPVAKLPIVEEFIVSQSSSAPALETSDPSPIMENAAVRTIVQASTATVYLERARSLRDVTEIKLYDPRPDAPLLRSHRAVDATSTVRLFTILETVIDAATGLMFQDQVLIPETSYFVPDKAAGNLNRLGLIRLDEGEDIIVGCNNVHADYQHWITQCMPAIDWALRQKRTRPVRLLLPSLAAWQEEMLDVLGYGQVPRVTMQPNTFYYLPHAEYSEFLNGATSFNVCLTAYDTARRFLERLPSTEASHSVVFVPCSNPEYGTIRNLDEVIELLRQRGVYIVDPNLPMSDRINIFRNARAVIGPFGPGLSDILFCKPGTLLWEWMPGHYQNVSINRLAQAASADYWGDVFESDAITGMSGQWAVNPGVIVQRLSEISQRLATQAAHPEGTSASIGLSRIVGRPLDELMLAFENLGDNREFGLVQRHAGTEPLGLLRFADMSLAKLVAALRARFAALGTVDTVEVYLAGEQPGRREFMVHETSLDTRYPTFIWEHEIAADRLREQEAIRLGFLRQKILEDVATGAKIWVWREFGMTDPNRLLPLLNILRSLGPNTLLWVVAADEAHPPGTVERLDADFIKGYVERLTPDDNATDISPRSWFQVCDNACALCNLISAQSETPHEVVTSGPKPSTAMQRLVQSASIPVAEARLDASVRRDSRLSQLWKWLRGTRYRH